MMLIGLFAMAAAGPATGNIMAADWQAMTITQVASETMPGQPLYLRVAAGDLDGDGTADEALLQLTCSDGAVQSAAYQVISARGGGASTGKATYKRMHKPMTITKEWGAASPQLSAMKPTYDIKMMKGARLTSVLDDWHAITLSSTAGLCAATAESAAKITKSRSNIQNN